MSTVASSRRFEDLKDELISLKEKIRIHLRRNASDITINKLWMDGDRLIEMIRNEVTKCPLPIQSEMNSRFYSLKNEWTAFKSTAGRPVMIGDPHPSSTSNNSAFGHPATQRQILAQGIESLEQTSQSLQRAHIVARETEEIGTNIMGELSSQRESLLRTRQTLDGNTEHLKQSHRLIRTINTQLITNKCLLILIIILEIVIFSAIILFRFVLKHK